MSDKPEEQQQGARKHQPSFEEVLQGVQVEEPKPPAAPKKSAQPTFEEILESVRPASEPPKPQQQGKSRPQRQKEERKMPIVVRKPTLEPSVAAHSWLRWRKLRDKPLPKIARCGASSQKR